MQEDQGTYNSTQEELLYALTYSFRKSMHSVRQKSSNARSRVTLLVASAIILKNDNVTSTRCPLVVVTSTRAF